MAASPQRDRLVARLGELVEAERRRARLRSMGTALKGLGRIVGIVMGVASWLFIIAMLAAATLIVAAAVSPWLGLIAVPLLPAAIWLGIDSVRALLRERRVGPTAATLRHAEQRACVRIVLALPGAGDALARSDLERALARDGGPVTDLDDLIRALHVLGVVCARPFDADGKKQAPFEQVSLTEYGRGFVEPPSR